MYREKLGNLFHETHNEILKMFKEHNVNRIDFDIDNLDYDEILKVLYYIDDYDNVKNNFIKYLYSLTYILS